MIKSLHPIADGPSPGSRHWLEDERIEPRHTRSMSGVDRGSSGRLIAELRRGNDVHRQLVWFKGFRHPAAGVRGFGHLTRPVSLRVLDHIGMTTGSYLLEGGRLTPGRIASVAADIDRLMGRPVSGLIELGRTLVVVEDRP